MEIKITPEQAVLVMDVWELIGVENMNKQEQELYHSIKKQKEERNNKLNPCHCDHFFRSAGAKYATCIKCGMKSK